jgi:hypothetical protein
MIQKKIRIKQERKKGIKTNNDKKSN